MIEWFDPRKFSLRIWWEGNTLRFEAGWPIGFSYLVLFGAGILLGWWLS